MVSYFQLLDTLRYHIVYTVQLGIELNSEDKLESCLSEEKRGSGLLLMLLVLTSGRNLLSPNHHNLVIN